MDVRRIIVGRPLRIFFGLSLDVRWMLLGSTLTFRRPLFERCSIDLCRRFIGISLDVRWVVVPTYIDFARLRSGSSGLGNRESNSLRVIVLVQGRAGNGKKANRASRFDVEQMAF